ncbi:hypothetical protein GTQ40_10540 [Flavobacteriaceae bacterium R38]|nr:hypothetical protein [Flavobacteriaceae bacterium R38]
MRHKGVLFLIGLMSIGILSAQKKNDECSRNLSIFFQFVKIKSYDEAYEPWKSTWDDCPELNKAVYSLGEKILVNKIEKNEDKEKYIEMLLKVYDDGHKYFPKEFTLAESISDKALLLFNEKRIGDEELYNLLHKGFVEDKENFKNPKSLFLYFSVSENLYESKNKELQVVFDVYDDVNDRIEQESKILSKIIDQLLPKEESGALTVKEKKSLKRARVNLNSYRLIEKNINKKLDVLVSCENLIPLYQKGFDQKGSDVLWISRAAKRMEVNGCTKNPLYVKLTKALDELNPSATSKYLLGRLLDEQGKTTEAIKYYNESIALETDNYKNAKIAYRIAAKLKNKQPAMARKYAQKALEYQPSLGVAYLLIADVYGSAANECGASSFEKRAIWWRAAEVAKKAGTVDPSLKSRVSQTVKSYNQRAPSRQDIFQSGMAGKTITFKCWVGGSIKVPDL